MHKKNDKYHLRYQVSLYHRNAKLISESYEQNTVHKVFTCVYFFMMNKTPLYGLITANQEKKYLGKKPWKHRQQLVPTCGTSR